MRTEPILLGRNCVSLTPQMVKKWWLGLQIEDHFARGRIIDLSWGAANMLDILSKGVATVIVEPIEIGKIPYRPKDKIDLPEI